jgi:hypothetical protein
MDKARLSPEFGFEEFIAINGWLDEYGEAGIEMQAQNIDDASDGEAHLVLVTTDAGDRVRGSRVQ